MQGRRFLPSKNIIRRGKRMKRTGMAIVVLTVALAGMAGCSKDEDPAGAVSTGAVSATVARQTATLKKGVTKIAQRGRPGLRVRVFRLTLEDGVEVDRKLVSDSVRRKPVNKIVLKGTQ